MTSLPVEKRFGRKITAFETDLFCKALPLRTKSSHHSGRRGVTPCKEARGAVIVACMWN